MALLWDGRLGQIVKGMQTDERMVALPEMFRFSTFLKGAPAAAAAPFAGGLARRLNPVLSHPPGRSARDDAGQACFRSHSWSRCWL